jgi:hypothetical protein
MPSQKPHEKELPVSRTTPCIPSPPKSCTETAYWTSWASYLSTENFERMRSAAGLKTTEPNRDEKVLKARSLISQYSDIIIPRGTAETVFVSHTPRKFVRTVLIAISQAASLRDARAKSLFMHTARISQLSIKGLDLR